MTSAETLRDARARAQLTQAELGRRAGLPQSVISAYERGHRQPTVPMLTRLVAAAGFDLVLDLHPHLPSRFSGVVGQRVEPHRSGARKLLARRGYGDPVVLGSVARGTDGADSDLDIAVDVPASTSLWQLNRVAIDLEDLLGVAVDLVPRRALREHVAMAAAEDMVPL